MANGSPCPAIFVSNPRPNLRLRLRPSHIPRHHLPLLLLPFKSPLIQQYSTQIHIKALCFEERSARYLTSNSLFARLYVGSLTSRQIGCSTDARYKDSLDFCLDTWNSIRYPEACSLAFVLLMGSGHLQQPGRSGWDPREPCPAAALSGSDSLLLPS